MKFGKRRQKADAPAPPEAPAHGEDTAPPPVTRSWTVPAPEAPVHEPSAAHEPAVEGEAVELPAAEPPAVEFHQPLPLTISQAQPAPPVVEQPSAAAERPFQQPASGAPVTMFGDSAVAAGHAAAPGPSWQEPVMELANERPELVVAAAFAGGVLAAMILRRLGH